MSLVNHAAYLYVHSKELIVLNKKLKRLSKNAEKHKKRGERESDFGRVHKHAKRHAEAGEDIRTLLKKHNRILTKLRQHQVVHANELRKEHKVR